MWVGLLTHADVLPGMNRGAARPVGLVMGSECGQASPSEGLNDALVRMVEWQPVVGLLTVGNVGE